MGAKANFIYDMANEDQPKPMVKDFKDALCLKGDFIQYKNKGDVGAAVEAFFEKYEPKYNWGLKDHEKDSIAQSGSLILASMPTPRY